MSDCKLFRPRIYRGQAGLGQVRARRRYTYQRGADISTKTQSLQISKINPDVGRDSLNRYRVGRVLVEQFFVRLLCTARVIENGQQLDV